MVESVVIESVVIGSVVAESLVTESVVIESVGLWTVGLVVIQLASVSRTCSVEAGFFRHIQSFSLACSSVKAKGRPVSLFGSIA